MKAIFHVSLVAALALAAPLPGFAVCFDEEAMALSHRDHTKIAMQLMRLLPEEVVWGNESEGRRRSVGRFEPALLTPDPGRVEVLYFVDFVSGWRCAERLFKSWRASLPERVDVRVLVIRQINWKRGPFDYGGEIQQAVFFGGQLLGRESEVLDAITSRLRKRGYRSLDTTYEADLVLEELGIEKGTFTKFREDPEVLGRARWATLAIRMLKSASHGMNKRGHQYLYPMMIIDGRHSISTTDTKDPGETFRIANRLIRQALDRERQGDFPTNNDELAGWMAGRSGEVFRLVAFGEDRTKAVYNGSRKEFWVLGESGNVKRVAPITGKGKASRVVFRSPGKPTVHQHTWRIARQFVSYEGAGGPQRYGAFLLTDWLSAPETHWVEMPWKGHGAALAFSPDGTVEAHNEAGPIFGSWWLEAGKLHVSLAEHGVSSWPWEEVARQVGFEVPQESLTPWKR